MLAKVKLALRISVSAFDAEITQLIQAALADLKIAGIIDTSGTTPTPFTDQTTDALIIQAVTTYCKWHFGEPTDAERLKQAYETQKGQLMQATGYTQWSEA